MAGGRRFQVDFEDRDFTTYSGLFQLTSCEKQVFKIYKAISIISVLQF